MCKIDIMKTLEELRSYLSSLRKGDYQNDNYQAFLKAIHFSFKVPFIHIAGTNGKGTTSNYINNAYIYSGYKVGYYHSPYFYSPLENILINNKEISFEDFINILSKYEKQIKKFNLSEFEVETFIMFTYFSEQKCDICVIECGMGGEYDATNVAAPVISVVTSVSIEHSSFLGESISEIAYHKAGIIKDYIPVAIGNIEGDALTVIAEKSRECESKVVTPVHLIVNDINLNGSNISFPPYFDTIKTELNNSFSILDAEIAIATILEIKDRFPLKEGTIRQLVLTPRPICRFEVVKNDPLIILDGGHNPEAIRNLVNTINTLNFDKKIHIIFASFRDKNINSIFPILSTLTSDISLTTFSHERARKEDDYFLYLREYEFYDDYIEIIKRKCDEFKDDIILITGSLAFTSVVRDDIKKGRI